MPTSNNSVPCTNQNNLADSLVLKEESRTTFLNPLEAHLQKLQPANPVEAAVVEEMVADFWHLSRRYTIDLVRLDVAADTSTAEESAAAESRLLASYEVRLRRKYNRSLKSLQMLRSFHPTNQPPADPKRRLPNETLMSGALNPGRMKMWEILGRRDKAVGLGNGAQ